MGNFVMCFLYMWAEDIFEKETTFFWGVIFFFFTVTEITDKMQSIQKITCK